MIDIESNISAIRGAKTVDGDYIGKKVTELEDTVINNAEELKKRFDAATIEVLDPHFREGMEEVSCALEQLTSQVNTELSEKTQQGHTHLLTDILDFTVNSVDNQIQANWMETNSESKAYIKNKPTIYPWALRSTKPQYTADEVGAAAEEHTHLANDITGGVLSVANGGTGADSVSGMRETLGIKCGKASVVIPADETSASVQITFDKPYESANYAIVLGVYGESQAGGVYQRGVAWSNRLATGFKLSAGMASSTYTGDITINVNWMTMSY